MAELHSAYAWYNDPLRHDAASCRTCRFVKTAYADCSECQGDITQDCSACKHRCIFDENPERFFINPPTLISDEVTEANVREAKYMESFVWITVGAALVVCLTVLTAVTLRESLKSG